MKDNHSGFTLIELLIGMTIVSLLSTTVFSSVQSGVQSAKAADIARDVSLIEKAFTYKALDEGITQWWHESAFPEQRNWAPYIQDIAEAGINEFLPIAPENEEPNAEYSYAYDNDGELAEVPTTGCDGVGISNSQKNRRINRGMSIAIGLGVEGSDQKFQSTFEELDNIFDGGDGYYCGRIRTRAIDHPDPNRNYDNIRYFFDFDQTPNH